MAAFNDGNPTERPVPHKLLFVHSGSPKKRLTFEVAATLGLEIYLFNPVPNWAADLAHQCFFTADHSLTDIIAMAEDLHHRIGLDGVVTFWEEDVPTCALIAHQLGLRGNNPIAALHARSKYHMRQAFQQADIPVPPFRLVNSLESLRLACAEIGVPAVLKPEWGSDSEWVTRIDSVDQACAIFTNIQNLVRVQDCIFPYPAGNFVLEGFLSGPEVSVEGVVQGGRVTLYAIIDKAAMDEDNFIERGECTPSRLPGAVQEEIRDMVCRGVRAMGLEHSGIHAEVKITPEGPRIVEIGARMGGDCIHALVKRVYGVDLAEENIRVALGLPAHTSPAARGCGISRTLVPKRSGRVRLRSKHPLRASRSLIEVVLTKYQGDRVSIPPEGYDNLAWVSVWGRTHGEAARRLENTSARLENAFVIEPDMFETYTATVMPL